MNPNLPLSVRSIPSLFRNSRRCLAASCSACRSGSFRAERELAGTQTTVPFSSVDWPPGVGSSAEQLVSSTFSRLCTRIARVDRPYESQTPLRSKAEQRKSWELKQGRYARTGSDQKTLKLSARCPK